MAVGVLPFALDHVKGRRVVRELVDCLELVYRKVAELNPADVGLVVAPCASRDLLDVLTVLQLLEHEALPCVLLLVAAAAPRVLQRVVVVSVRPRPVRAPEGALRDIQYSLTLRLGLPVEDRAPLAQVRRVQHFAQWVRPVSGLHDAPRLEAGGLEAHGGSVPSADGHLQAHRRLLFLGGVTDIHVAVVHVVLAPLAVREEHRQALPLGRRSAGRVVRVHTVSDGDQELGVEAE
eukprot:scaffold41518_cov91-Phaeocystis_antarctica.AAC.1